MSTLLGAQGGLLIGIDLQKDVSVSEAAYNDDCGITADFNLNLLTRINSELSGEFDLRNFAHKAIYCESEQRVEISIVSRLKPKVAIGSRVFQFESGEEILTEYSHKYTIDGFAKFASRCIIIGPTSATILACYTWY